MKRREDAEAAAKAARREEADRVYARLKGEQEAAAAAREEQEFLINLLHQEEAEARQRAQETARREHQVRAVASVNALLPLTKYILVVMVCLCSKASPSMYPFIISDVRNQGLPCIVKHCTP